MRASCRTASTNVARNLGVKDYDGPRDRGGGYENARRYRITPRDGHCRTGPTESGFLRRRAGHAAGEEKRQPGRPWDLSPLLRGRRRAPGNGPHVLSLVSAGAGPRGPRLEQGGLPRRAARQPRVLGEAIRSLRRHHDADRDTLWRSGAAVDRSARASRGPRGIRGRAHAPLHAVGRRSGCCGASDQGPRRRAAPTCRCRRKMPTAWSFASRSACAAASCHGISR